MSLFAWADVLVSAVVLIAFIRHEGRRASIPGLWVPVAGNCADEIIAGVDRWGELAEGAGVDESEHDRLARLFNP